jgi:cysteine desulfurase
MQELLADPLPYGNPSAVHAAGRRARQRLDVARRQVAALFAVHERQVIFTSGGTEANHLALVGCARAAGYRGHVVTSAIEHPSVLESCRLLEELGMDVTRVAPTPAGFLQPGEVQAALRPDTRLVSIMAANNETGVIQPVAAIAGICRAQGIPLHTDAVQLAGRHWLDLSALPVSLLSVSAHKLGGPTGVGALIHAADYPVMPVLVGGGQEYQRRSGTENISGIVGFGMAAARYTPETIATEQSRMHAMREILETRLQQSMTGCIVFGSEAQGDDGASDRRLANTVAFAVPGLEGATLVMHLDLAGFAVSGGAACASGKLGTSHVLHAMGIPELLARGMVRVSLGWTTQPEEVHRFADALIRTVERLRAVATPILSGNRK